jgi:MFS family permease
VNTLFTQTVSFAADEFGSSDTAQGAAGAIVRCGIVFALGLVFLADRKGRRRMLIVSAVLAPVLCGLGALAPRWCGSPSRRPSGRPVGIALLLLVGIVAAEEMPRNSRAYAISVVAMAGGLGAGLCVVALPFADLGVQGWRVVYVVPIAFLVVAWDLWRRLPETRRFEAPHITAPPLQRRRFILLAASGLLTNLLVAPQSFFNNRYLKNVRNYSAAKIALFTLCTNTPGGVGIVAGGKLADTRGRRLVGAIALAGGSIFTVIQFSVGGWPMWVSSTGAAVVGGAAVPALGVYGVELFPTGNRGKAQRPHLDAGAGGVEHRAARCRLGPRPGLRLRRRDGDPGHRPARGGGARGDHLPGDGPPRAGGPQPGGPHGRAGAVRGVAASRPRLTPVRRRRPSGRGPCPRSSGA